MNSLKIKGFGKVVPRARVRSRCLIGCPTNLSTMVDTIGLGWSHPMSAAQC